MMMDSKKSYNKSPSSIPITIYPGSGLTGEVHPANCIGLPGDKSISHRAVLLAAMAEGRSRLGNFSITGVTKVMLSALDELNISWKLEGSSLIIQGVGLSPEFPSNHYSVKASDIPFLINCGNSATTMRLLSGTLANWGVRANLDGSESLRNRPMLRIVEPLQMMGVDIRADNGHAPLEIYPSRLPLRALEYTLPIPSAQVKTCLLFAGLGADGTTTLIEHGPTRDHTERMMRTMGVSIECSQDSSISLYVTKLIPPNSGFLKPIDMEIPGDFSAAAFLVVAALVTPGSRIVIHNVGLNPTRTGLLDTLQDMGADIQITNLIERNRETIGDLVVNHSHLHSVHVSGDKVVRMIDEFPAFAVAAACAEGVSKVVEARELRYKESDRISSMGTELLKLGVQFSEMEDGFIINGGLPFIGGDVDSHGDHRLAMALSIAGLISQSPVTIEDSEIISESFPEFVPLLQQLGAKIHRCEKL